MDTGSAPLRPFVIYAQQPDVPSVLAHGVEFSDGRASVRFASVGDIAPVIYDGGAEAIHVTTAAGPALLHWLPGPG